MTNYLFLQSKSLVEETEAFLVSKKLFHHNIFRVPQKITYLPIKFLRMGCLERLKGFIIWSVSYLAIIWVASKFIGEPSQIDPNIRSVIMYAATFLPLFLLAFAVPSLYMHSGVSVDGIRFVCEYLLKSDFINKDEIEILKDYLKTFEERVKIRISTYKWIAGIGWAIFIYIFSKAMELIKNAPLIEIRNLWLISSITLAIVGLIYFLISGYDAACNKLFRTLQFGCNEFSINFASAKHTQSPNQSFNPDAASTGSSLPPTS